MPGSMAGGQGVLHWGLREPGQDAWRLPPQPSWPAETRAVGPAVQTPFTAEDGRQSVHISLPASAGYALLDFALFFPDQRTWDNNGGRNYRIEIPPAKANRPAPRSMPPSRSISAKKSPLPAPLPGRAVRAPGGRGHPRGRPIQAPVAERVPGLVLHWGISAVFVQRVVRPAAGASAAGHGALRGPHRTDPVFRPGGPEPLAARDTQGRRPHGPPIRPQAAAVQSLAPLPGRQFLRPGARRLRTEGRHQLRSLRAWRTKSSGRR